jgi:hypothetical protein
MAVEDGWPPAPGGDGLGEREQRIGVQHGGIEIPYPGAELTQVSGHACQASQSAGRLPQRSPVVAQQSLGAGDRESARLELVTEGPGARRPASEFPAGLLEQRQDAQYRSRGTADGSFVKGDRDEPLDQLSI